MSYTTPPIANRLAYNRGWQNPNLPWILNSTDISSIFYLKSFLLLKEYLRFHQLNLLSFEIKSMTNNKKLINLLIYKHLPHKRKKHQQFPFYQSFSKAAFFTLCRSNWNIFDHNTKLNINQSKTYHQQQKLQQVSRQIKFRFTRQLVLPKMSTKKFKTRFHGYFLPWKRALMKKKRFFAKQLQTTRKYRKLLLRRNQNFRKYILWKKNLCHTSIALAKTKIYNFSGEKKTNWLLSKAKNLNLSKSSLITKSNRLTSNNYNKQLISNQKQLSSFKIQFFVQNYIKSFAGLTPIVKIKFVSDLTDAGDLYDRYRFRFRLKQFANERFFKRLLLAFSNTQRYLNPQLIADLIASEIASVRKHKRLLRNIDTLFDATHSKYVLGYKIVIDGKINGKMKASKQIFKLKGRETVPTQEFNKKISYALGVSRTYTGLFGVRIWLYY